MKLARLQRSSVVSSALANAGFFALAAGVFITFSILYTRTYGIERYGEFSFLLNTATALISLGAYEGFLVAHSPTQSRERFDAFNSEFHLLNIGLIAVAGVAFCAVTGRIDPIVITAVLLAIYLDYRSQSSIAVLITCRDNWKIRAYRTCYQILLVVIFVALQVSGVGLALSFALALLVASVTNFSLLAMSARRNLPPRTEGAMALSDVSWRILAIAVTTNLATVLMLLLDKLAIRWFDIGSGDSVGLYFLFFDLATRAEAFFLLLAVPVTNHLFTQIRKGMATKPEVVRMMMGCVAIGLVFAAGGALVVPVLYGVSLDGVGLLPWLFGVYIAARGLRYLIKAMCNAAGLHGTLMTSNYLVLGTGALLMALALLLGEGALSVVTLAAIIATAHAARGLMFAKTLNEADAVRRDIGAEAVRHA